MPLLIAVFATGRRDWGGQRQDDQSSNADRQSRHPIAAAEDVVEKSHLLAPRARRGS
jgi:hypothetical protein